MKKTFTFFLFCCFSLTGFSQVLFSEDFNSISLAEGAAKVPSTWVVENRDGQMAIDNPVNYPFDQAAYAMDAWAITDINLSGEIAVISTSLFGPVDNITDRWLISPKVSGVKGTSHLFWRGFTDNTEALDNCEIWVVSSIAGAVPNSSDFLADNANKVETFKMKPDEFNNYAIDLSAFEGQDIYFAFRNLSFLPAKIILDDFEIKDALEDDIAVKALTMPTYILSGPTTISTEVTSMSRNPITSITLKYEVMGTGISKTETFDVDLPKIAEVTEVTFSDFAELSVGGFDVEVTVEKVNGQVDGNEEDNQKQGFVSAMDDPPLKRILIQEYTGAWCGWCPAGALVLEDIAAGDPTVIPVGIHTGDEMEIAEGIEIAGVAASGYPSASFDFNRFTGEDGIGVSRDQWFNRTLERLQAIVPVELDVDHVYNSATRELEVTVDTRFIGTVKDDLRLNVWIIEDEVTGPLDEVGNNRWNNANYDNTNPSSPFFGMGPYLEPDEFQHAHVFNASLTGSWGDENAFPREVSAGEMIQNSYSFTLPTAAGAEQHWKADDIHVIAFVSHYELNPRKRYVLNVNRGKTFLVGTDEVAIEALSGVSINPNPVSSTAILSIELQESTDLQISVFNQLGQEVLQPIQANFPAGTSQKNLAMEGLPNGIYVVNLRDQNGGLHSQKLLLNK